MKFLDNLFFKKLKPYFVKGGKWEKLYPLYEGAATFFFTTSDRTKTGSHVRDAIDLKRMMVLVVFSMIPCFIFGMYNVGVQQLAYAEGVWELGGAQSLASYATANISFWHALGLGAMKVLPLMFVVYTVGGIVEVIFCIIRKHEINEGFFVSGFLITLILPPTIPLWQVAVGTIFGILIGKEIFGGTGMNILNPALTARVFIFFAYPASIAGDKVWVAPYSDGKPVDFILNGIGSGGAQAVSHPTALAQAADHSSTVLYNSWDAFLGFIPGSIGETSALLCILGAIFLIVIGVASWRTMLGTLIGATIYLLIVQALLPGIIESKSVDITDTSNHIFSLGLEHLLYGGFAFGLVFMCTDPVSSSGTNKGKWIFGLLVGFLAMFIRTFNPAYPEGIMLAILFMNVFAPLIDYFVVKSNIKRRLSRA